MGKTYMGIPREEIPWFPTIEKEKCVGCLECANFRQNGVFMVEENPNPNTKSTSIWEKLRKRPKVVNPFNCVVGCFACAQLCKTEAVKFPERKEFMKTLRQLALKHGKQS
jgi:NAD-dependent dihydropyrimidine dehydrogenase PreA subunit